MKIQKKT